MEQRCVLSGLTPQQIAYLKPIYRQYQIAMERRRKIAILEFLYGSKEARRAKDGEAVYEINKNGLLLEVGYFYKLDTKGCGVEFSCVVELIEASIYSAEVCIIMYDDFRHRDCFWDYTPFIVDNERLRELTEKEREIVINTLHSSRIRG